MASGRSRLPHVPGRGERRGRYRAHPLRLCYAPRVGTPWWRYTWRTTLGLGFLTFSVTAMVTAVLRLVEIGSCATSPVYVTIRPCPEGAEALIGLVAGAPLLGFLGLALYVTRIDRRRPSPFDDGPDWSTWAWPALFLGFARVFVVAANAFAAVEETGGAIGMWVCAAVFVLMGGGPLLLNRHALPAQAFGGPRRQELASVAERFASAATQPASVPDRVIVPPADGGSAPERSPADDLAGALERLAALHRAGHLGDAEFSAAKAQVLRRARSEGR